MGLESATLMVRSMEAGMNGARTVDENLLHLDTKLERH